MKDLNKLLDSYAKLIVYIGVNVQKGEPLLLNAPVEALELARAITKYAYIKGASDVIVTFSDDEITRLSYEYKSNEELGIIPQWMVDKLEYYNKKGAAKIVITADNPELLKNIPSEKIAIASNAKNKAFSDIMKYTINDINSWCVVAMPSIAWAKKLFPMLSDEEAVDKLWDLIFKTTRMYSENPVEEWEKHIKNLEQKAEFLNDNKFDYLVYSSSNGTDLKVGLPKDHIWMSASSKNSRGTRFIPNMPTEEVFTLPHRDKIEGHLVSTLPLCFNGNIIKDIELDFEKGRVVKFNASEGKEILENMFKDDDKSRYLGEVAIVPYSSPINKTGILFYNTLFDENASCHFAFGACYPTCLVGGTKLSDDELMERGGNVSLNHEDFMVGAKDLSITGVKVKDGKEEKIEIFKDGEWII